MAEALDEAGARYDKFFALLEEGMIDKLASKPEPMVIPLVRLLLVKDGEC